MPAEQAERKIKVLLIAEAANPEWVSVPLEGWSHSRAISRVTDSHLVTQIRNAPAIERAGLELNVDFTAIDSEAVAFPLYRLGQLLRGGDGKGWTTVTAVQALSYYYFEYLVWQKYADALCKGEFDLVHRVTPLSPTIPSSMAWKCRRIGVPFVLGPLNGGVPWPREFDRERRLEKEWLSYIRNIYRLLPGYRSTRKDAAALIIGSGDTLAQMPEKYRDRCIYIPENAIDPKRFSSPVKGEVRKPLRLAFVGRLVPYKGADMLLEAAAPLVKDGRCEIDFIGDGPEMPRLQQICRELNIENGVKLDGWVPHEHLQQRLVQSDVFAFPSIREFGGAVVVEAMVLGLVPLIVDYAGPSELVTVDTGYKVPLGSRPQIVAGFRETIEHLVENPSGIREMGQRARKRVIDGFTWEAKARQTNEVYRWVLGRRRDKPDFGIPLDCRRIPLESEV